MTVQFAVLGSGSRGNSTLIRQGDGPGILIDMGLGPRSLEQRLASVGADWSRVSAVVLTHTHGDHINSATLKLMVKREIPLYCHEGHRFELEHDQGFHDLERLGLIRHYDAVPFLTPCGFRIESIALKHDGPTFGFRVETASRRKGRAFAVGYVADTGSWTEAMTDCLADVDLLGVEFNHDVLMQKTSGRSPALIARNLGDRGHLSNRQGAEFVGSVLSKSRRRRFAHLVLLHLSEQCNRPEIAIDEARQAMAQAGRRASIHAAKQSPAFPSLSLGPSALPLNLKPRVESPPRQAARARAGFPPELTLPGLNVELP